jgi:hypothetical protein
MNRRLLALPILLLSAGAAGVTTAGPAAAGGGGGVTCSFVGSTTAQVSALDLPDPVRAGSTVSGVVTIQRLPGSTGAVEVGLAPSSWTRTDACVIVPSGRSSVSFDVAISPVTTDGHYATVGAYATSDGSDQQTASSLVVRD